MTQGHSAVVAALIFTQNANAKLAKANMDAATFINTFLEHARLSRANLSRA